MVVPTGMDYNGDKEINTQPGDTIQLNAKLAPANVTQSRLFWRSTNPEIATVDHNGVVAVSNKLATSRAEGDNTCKIIAESIYANGPVLEVTINGGDTGGIEGITDCENDDIDYAHSYDVYGINGVKVGNSIEGLEKGVYIIRQGSLVKKIAIK